MISKCILIFSCVFVPILAKRSLKIASFAAFPPYFIYDAQQNKLSGIGSKEYGEVLDRLFKMNITYLTKEQSYGITAINGTEYDGIIGLIQRNEAEFGILPVQMDILHDPGLFGPVCRPFQAVMVTFYKTTTVKSVDVTKAAEYIFDGNIWIVFMFFCVAFIISNYLFYKMVGQDFNFLENFWQMSCIIFGNFDSNLRNYSKPALSLFVVFIYLITIMFLTMFAVSLIVKPRPDYVETFKEVPKRSLKPLFIKNNAYWNQFLNAKTGPYKEVWDICRRSGIDKCMLGQENGVKLVVDGIENEDVAIFMLQSLMFWIYPLAKAMYSSKHLHIADEQMKPSLYAYMYSKNISSEKRKILDRKLRYTFDLGLISKVFKDSSLKGAKIAAETLDKKLSMKHFIEYDEINRFEETEQNEEDTKWSPIKIRNLESILNIVFISLILGTMIMMLEYIIYIIKKYPNHVN